MLDRKLPGKQLDDTPNNERQQTKTMSSSPGDTVVGSQPPAIEGLQSLIDARTPTSTTTAGSSPLAAIAAAVKDETIDPLSVYYCIKPNLAVPFATASLWESCAFKSVISGVMGGGMGFFFGFLMGSYDNNVHTDQRMSGKSTRIQLRAAYRQMRGKSMSFAKQFGGVGLIYSGVECVIAKERGTHDIANAVYAGAVSGGVLAARAGPSAMLMGAGGFALFSAAIETYMMS
jgi:import inner membrane translocase subunit TIM22